MTFKLAAQIMGELVDGFNVSGVRVRNGALIIAGVNRYLGEFAGPVSGDSGSA